MENLDDPDTFKCFLCNSLTPKCSLIQARGKDEDDDKLKDLELHNFALGMIKIDNQMRSHKLIKDRSRRENESFKNDTFSDHDSLDQHEDQERISNVQLQDEEEGEEDEEAKEGGEEDIKIEEMTKDGEFDIEENKNYSPVFKSKTNFRSNVNVKLGTSTRAKGKHPSMGIDSPLPVIIINSKENAGVNDRTNEETPVPWEENNLNTSRQLKSKKHHKKKKEKITNLKFRYDGFNKLRFVYSRIIPR
jgi:hypothetical protein